METPSQPPSGDSVTRVNYVLGGITVSFLLLAGLLLANLWGRPVPPVPIALVDPSFLDPAPWRQTYADLVQAKEDLSDFDCYVCHDEKEPPPIRFDENHNIVLPDEHSNIRLEHGSHDRNNLCYNCHNEQNLLTFQTRDGRELAFEHSTALCGSCHGPTYRDWEGGAHGRTSGYWDLSRGPMHRLDCANCHDPHSPAIPKRTPAPGPHPLHPAAPPVQ
jgi:uncharacterized CHY-type Zn-finger protein